MTFSWTNPTTYVDGSAIPPDLKKEIVTRIYLQGADGVWKIIVTSDPGTTSWTGMVVDVIRGVPNKYVYDCLIPAKSNPSAKSAPPLEYTAPYLPLSPPTDFKVSPPSGLQVK